MSNEKTNESRIRGAGLRMALKFIPQDLLDQAPATLEKYLLNQLSDVELDSQEVSSCYLIAPNDVDGGLRIMLVTMDETCTVIRIIKKTTLGELFRAILNEAKDM